VKYSEGKIGRIFVLKFEDKEVLSEELEKFCRKERVKSATLLFIGGMRSGELVSGPKKPAIPPEPNKLKFGDGWDIMGIGTVFSGPQGPQIHIHGAMGRKSRALAGCLRGRSKAFIVVEAIILELRGVNAVKALDPQTGLNLLQLSRPNAF
jgi:uncharacterized protein